MYSKPRQIGWSALNIQLVVSELRGTNKPLAIGVKAALSRNLSRYPPQDIMDLRDAVEKEIMECEVCRYWFATSSMKSVQGKLLCAADRQKLPIEVKREAGIE